MDILSCSTSLLTCLSLQCTAQVKLCVLLPDITLTNCWKVRAELVLEYLGMVRVIISSSDRAGCNFSHYLHLELISKC